MKPVLPRRAWPALAAALLLLAAAAAWPTREPDAPALLGQAAPHSPLQRLDAGAPAFAPASMQGRVWLLNAWASWCAPCRDEHPLLLELAHGEGLAIVGLNHRDDGRAAQEWLLRLGDPYLVNAVDPQGDAASAWAIDGVPQSVLIDAAGVVRWRHAGALTREQWQRELRPLLQRLAAGAPG